MASIALIFFTVSNLAFDAFKRVRKAEVQLLTDRDYLDMFEKLMRGETATTFDSSLRTTDI